MNLKKFISSQLKMRIVAPFVAILLYRIGSCLVVAAKKSPISGKQICIVGAGPVGLFQAITLLHQDPSAKVSVFERQPQQPRTVNAFGIGISARMKECLSSIPGLLETVCQKRAGILISRSDLSDQLRSFLLSKYPQCTLYYQEGCQTVDFSRRCFVTSKGRKMKYDLLVATDGVRSPIRKQLVNAKQLSEQHYISKLKWKALVMPPQSFLDPLSFRPLLHKDLVAGRVLSRYPHGHIFLMFWEGTNKNPGSVQTSGELKDMIRHILQNGSNKMSSNDRFFRFGLPNSESVVTNSSQIVDFYEDAVEEFVAAPDGKSHTVKLDRYHSDAVALVGDAAHGMYNFLGQGCSCGMRSAQILVDCLLEERNDDYQYTSRQSLNQRLVTYTKRALPDAHAVTDMNLTSMLRRSNPCLKFISAMLLKVKFQQNQSIFQLIGKPEIPYQDIARLNRLLIWLSKFVWRSQRTPVK